MVRHLLVKQVQLYWQCRGEAGPRQAVPWSTSGCAEHILRPLDCALRLSLGAPPSATIRPSLDVLLGTQMLELQVSGSPGSGALLSNNIYCEWVPDRLISFHFKTYHAYHHPLASGLNPRPSQVNPQQLLGIIQLADDSETWARRNRYGRFRPPGWRSRREQIRHSRNASATGLISDGRPTLSSEVTGTPASGGSPQLDRFRSFSEAPCSIETASTAVPPQSPAGDSGPLPRIAARSGSSGGSAAGSAAGSALPVLLHVSRSIPGDLVGRRDPAAGALPHQPLSFTQQPSHLPGSLGGAHLQEASPEGLQRGDAAKQVTWQDVWRYAVRSVLYDIRMRRHSTNAPM